MKQFEIWWKNYLVKGIGDKTMQPAAKELFKDYHSEGWRAAIEWILNSVCSEQDGYRAHLIAEDIKEELNEK